MARAINTGILCRECKVNEVLKHGHRCRFCRPTQASRAANDNANKPLSKRETWEARKATLAIAKRAVAHLCRYCHTAERVSGQEYCQADICKMRELARYGRPLTPALVESESYFDFLAETGQPVPERWKLTYRYLAWAETHQRLSSELVADLRRQLARRVFRVPTGTTYDQYLCEMSAHLNRIAQGGVHYHGIICDIRRTYPMATIEYDGGQNIARVRLLTDWGQDDFYIHCRESWLSSAEEA